MFCSKCGNQVVEGANFCSNCGNNLAQGEIQKAAVISEQQPISEQTQFLVSAQNAIQLRSIFNAVGYKHPSNKISKDYNDFFRQIKVDVIDPDMESTIIHFGIGLAITDGIMAKSIKFKDKDGKIIKDISRGEIVITNQRFIVLSGLGVFGTPEGFSYEFRKLKRVEPTEYQNYSQFVLYGKDKTDVYLEMTFISLQAALGQVLQVVSAFSKTSSGGNIVNYIEKKDQAQATQSYINAHLSRVRSLKQAFTELLVFLINPQP